MDMSKSESELSDFDEDCEPPNRPDNEPEPDEPDEPAINHRFLHSQSSSSAAMTMSFTSKHTPSSAAISASVALDHDQFPSSAEEKDAKLCRLWLECELLQRELAQTQAQLMASNAHCMVMTRSASEAHTELDNQKTKTCQSIKTVPRYVTHPEIKERWTIEQAEKAECEKEAAEKEAEKTVQELI